MSTVQPPQQREGSQRPESSTNNPRRGRGRGRGRGGADGRRQTTNRSGDVESTPKTDGQSSSHKAPPAQSSRTRKFGGQLSSSTPDAPENSKAGASSSGKPRQKKQDNIPVETNPQPSSSSARLDGVNVPDLTARLIASLKAPPYAECVICWSPILPQQPTWACTVSEETNRCCWGVFHNKCIVSWSKKNIQETKAAYQARNEDREGDWRCPGCQTQRAMPPGQYRCFCGATVDPKLSRLVLPHSCGMSCQRKRATCDHPCPLSCHPGPCPPCSTIIVKPCYCRKTSLSIRCNRMNLAGETPLSCGAICNKPLSCGNHRCQQVCHPDDCLPCDEISRSKCYCGRENRVLGCGEGKTVECSDGTETWEGRFSCDTTCERMYQCGKHSCEEACHPHSPNKTECPRSPNVITTCSCGKKTLEDLQITRTACTDPLPCCDSPCQKSLQDCEHLCAAFCHTGNCPPCQVEISLPCRCGETIQKIPCWQRQSKSDEVLCNKVCRALRNCGKHVCNRPCCPLAHIKTKGKGKHTRMDLVVEDLPLHECDLPCGKLLNCGLHRCERKDHKGLCPPCLQSSFEEMLCACGRTLLIPPIPCGTQIQCNYPCDRPGPSCGHPKTNHPCHEAEGCPPCPFLTAKPCACGKMTLPNVRCSQPRVSCGTPCGKSLACGFHACQRMCHGDECGPCDNVCGKDRKICLPDHHPCTKPCHAPSACPETEPCQSIVTLECPCGRIKRQVPCGKCSSNPVGRTDAMQPKCTSECAIAQRNARLAEALGIDQASSTRNERTMATYSPDLVSFTKANYNFVKMVEGTLADFVTSDRQTHALPHMPEAKRSFVYNLAKVYRIDTRMVDAEPQRSVELIRRIDTRIPTPLLTGVALPSAPSPLGKLQTKTGLSSSPARPTPAPLPSSGPRAWAAVASKTSPAPARTSLPPSTSASPARPNINLLPHQSIPSNWEEDD